MDNIDIILQKINEINEKMKNIENRLNSLEKAVPQLFENLKKKKDK